MTNEEKIINIVKEKGYITSEIAKDKSIDTWYLSNLVEKGKIQRIGRGVYIDKDGVYDEYFVFQYHHSKAIYSYSTALFLQELTESIPTSFEVTVYQGYNTHRFSSDVTVHYVKKDIYELGIIEQKSPYGNPIRMYNKERTLCDLVVSKIVVESEMFKKAFQAYFKLPDRDVNKLMKYAKKMNIETEMFTLVEVLS
jgi:predicted transcriptional regulator of viral defense system